MPELPLTRERFNNLIRDNTRLRAEAKAMRADIDKLVAERQRWLDEIEAAREN